MIRELNCSLARYLRLVPAPEVTTTGVTTGWRLPGTDKAKQHKIPAVESETEKHNTRALSVACSTSTQAKAPRSLLCHITAYAIRTCRLVSPACCHRALVTLSACKIDVPAYASRRRAAGGMRYNDPFASYNVYSYVFSPLLSNRAAPGWRRGPGSDPVYQQTLTIFKGLMIMKRVLGIMDTK